MVGKLGKQRNSEKDNLFFIIFILTVVSTVFLLVFSLGTSPLYQHKYIGWDSDIFLAMGKFSKQGLIPYKDFFDHKGPFIILIQWIGYVVGDGKMGVFMIQVIFLMATLLATYKILRLYYSEKASLGFSIAGLLILNMYYDKGNLTEEYCLPFLLWSTYFAVKFFKSGKSEHKCYQAVLYGVTFMIGATTRLTNSLPILILVIMGLVVMIRKKAWKSIWKNAVCFVSGAMIILLPVIFYFIKVGAFNEMIYATFIYNFKHGFERAPLTTSEMVNNMVLAVPFIVALVVGIISIFRFRINEEAHVKIIGATTVIFSGTAILMLLISRSYAHYFIIWMSAIIMAGGFMRNLMPHKKTFCIVAIGLCSLVALGKVGTAGIEIYDVLNSDYVEKYETKASEISSEIPSSDRDKVIAYNVKSYFYLITDIIPCYRNFNLQELHTRTDEVEMEGFAKDLSSLEAEYIVTGRSDGMYSRFIEEHYDLVDSNELFRLFGKKHK